MDLQLSGKHALVTGSTGGIGLAIAKALASEGAEVILNGRSSDRVLSAAEEIRAEIPDAVLNDFVGDLSLADRVDALAVQFKHIDILVNNLGVYGPKPFEKITDADWYSIIETNFMSGLRLSRHFLPRMKKSGWGRIIFISSESAANIPAEMIHYGVTKTMQVSLARGLAEMTRGTAVTVNTILAGPTRSEGVAGFIKGMAQSRNVAAEVVEKEFFQTVRPSSLLQRFATVDEIASMVAYVASPLSSATNGAALRVEGGVLSTIL
jgi:NAD(P)-dependent dehydrogenase (short-subunit alcohol dehydrogenase family)